MKKEQTVKRRDVIKGAVAAAALPTIIPSGVARAKDGKPAPSDRVVVGCIGLGGLGRTWHLEHRLLPNDRVEVAALCDVDRNHLNLAGRMHRAKTLKRAGVYKDFRKLVERKDLDAVMISTPDHWHTLCATAALEAGLDVYCEKPLTLTIEEGKELVKTTRRYGAVFQTGSQQRSDGRFRKACELVRNGKIGRITQVDTVLHPVHHGKWMPTTTPPDHLDWDFWLGPAPYVDYVESHVHYRFRWFLDYSGGVMTDWGAHHNDIAQWGLGMDGSGPVEVDGRESKFADQGPHTVALHFDVKYKYANGTTLICHSDKQTINGIDISRGVMFTGEDGWIFVSRTTIQASDEDILKIELGDGDIRLYESRDHHENWLDCIKSRERCICDVEIGHRSVSVCHMGNISMRLGRPLKWDPEKEQFVGDEQANRLMYKPMRGAWHL